jgi:peptide/nickel transport system permease protein
LGHQPSHRINTTAARFVTISAVGIGRLSLFALRRLALAVPLLLGVVVVNFVLIQMAPGDPVTVLVGDYPAPPEYVAEVRREFGLDRPLIERLGRYLSQLAQGNLGYSFANRQPVRDLIAGRLGATLQLTLTAMALATVLGLLLGIVSARARGTALDALTQGAALSGYSIPEFWLGQLLILLFAVWLGWLPSQGNRSLRAPAEGWGAVTDGMRYLILPALALSFRYIALIARLTRSAIVEVLGADFVLAARARGAGERTVLVGHALRHAALPVLTVVGYNFGFIFAGSALIETVFAWPGIGRLLFDSIARRDYPVMTAILLLVSATVVVVNLITDVLYVAVDPRVQLR